MDKPSPHMHSLTAITYYLAAVLLGLIFLPSFLFILELFLEIQTFKWQVPLIAAALVPFACLAVLQGQGGKIYAIAIGLLVLGLAKAFFISRLFYDITSDSSSYHADGILQILRDVNPIYEWMRGFSDIWVNHYPKITWYFASLTIYLTGDYHTGKMYNFMLIAATAAYVTGFLRNCGVSNAAALLAGIAAGLNPVAVLQIHSFYVDGALASLTTLVIFSALAMLSQPGRVDKAVFLMASCLLINIKFTGAATVAIIYAICGLTMFIRWLRDKTPARFKEGTHLAKIMVFVALIGGVIMGFNPYISNTLEEGTPFYPLVGKIKYDVVPAQSPRSFNENKTSTPVKLLLSIFSRTHNVIYKHGTAEPEFKLPFSIQEGELSHYAFNDVRIGAWGVLFSGIVCVSLGIYLLSGAWRNTAVTLGLLFILATVLINPGSWWARYAPHVALIPLLMCLPALRAPDAWLRHAASGVMMLFILNSALIIRPNMEQFANVTQHFDRDMDKMLAACGPGTYEIADTGGYHFEQIMSRRRIDLLYTKKDIANLYPANEVFVINIDALPVGKLYLRKEGCIAHP